TINSGQNTTSVTVNWSATGNHILSVNAANSCGTSSNQSLNIIVSVATGIIDPDDPFEIKIAPNPSQGDFYLLAKGVINKMIRIEIVNLSGQVVYNGQQKATANDYTRLLNLENLGGGLYKMKIFIDNKIYLRTIAKLN